MKTRGELTNYLKQAHAAFQDDAWAWVDRWPWTLIDPRGDREELSSGSKQVVIADDTHAYLIELAYSDRQQVVLALLRDTITRDELDPWHDGLNDSHQDPYGNDPGW